ncbi:MAG: RtcB family protein [Saprospiraceae bacterium]|nr:RtcB family protein [Saprospiraceae bacterium]
MSKLKITGKQLRSLGFPEGPVISVAMQVINSHYKHWEWDAVEALLTEVLTHPKTFLEDEILGKIAVKLVPEEKAEKYHDLLDKGIGFEVYGDEHIEQGAKHQMYTAVKLPIARQGALMPDAHQGYGLPIGGVLATEGAVIPYGVGVDIGCRMCLSVFDIRPSELVAKAGWFEQELIRSTLFGSGAEFKSPSDHEVMESEVFGLNKVVKGLHHKAWKQLGSSGSGNHFVEFGIVEVDSLDEVLKIPPGTYLGLLSHSGSRALGANIANHYTKLAKSLCRLPGEAQNLAWLKLDEEAGLDYWHAMDLAGDYASACHHVIHAKIAKSLKEKPIRMVENHHNFAWKEEVDGQELIVHRKGATPAAKDVLGIIPGSMTANGYIVKGKGNLASINSASHGAGRLMSRSSAFKSITEKMLKDILSDHGVKLIGGGLDEAPFAYKNIDEVMVAQSDLVDVVGKFTPKLVRMA